MIRFVLPSFQRHVFDSIRHRVSGLPFTDISPIFLPELCGAINLPPCTYIFAGFQVADETSKQVAAEVWQALEDDGWSRLLNHPLRFLQRQNLLEALHKRGVNHFRSYRLAELGAASPSFPVFLRSEYEHTGNLTGLLHTQAERCFKRMSV